MAIIVPRFPPIVDFTEGDGSLPGADAAQRNDLRIASPVLGAAQWEPWAKATAWALGKCGSLILCGVSSGVAVGSDTTWRFYTWPRYQCAARLWCIGLDMRVAEVDDWAGSGQFQVPSGTPLASWSLGPESFGATRVFRFVQLIESPTADPGEVTIKITNDSTSLSNVFVDSIHCYEIMRGAIEDFGPTPNTLGGFHAKAPNPFTDQTGALIVEGSDVGNSVDGLFRVVNDPTQLMVETRRSCLFSWYAPYLAGSNHLNDDWDNLFIRDPPVLARCTYGQTNRTIAVAAYGHGSTGAERKIRFTAQKSGDSTTLTLPLTTDGWVTGELDVETEDTSPSAVSGGIRSGIRERITVEAKRPVGGSGNVLGVCMAEAE